MSYAFPSLRRIVASFFVLTAIALGAASSLAATAYQVGATPTGIPFTFLDVNTNKIHGMMVDTIRAVAQRASIEVQVRATPFSSLIPSLMSNKIDIISAAMHKSAERAQVVDFTLPVYSYGEGLMVKADDSAQYASLDDLKGQIVGAQVGTVFLEMLNKKGIFKEVRGYDSIGDMARDISLGRVKAGLADRPIIAYQMRQGTFKGVRSANAYESLHVGEVCLIVRKGDADLLAKLNRAIGQIKADGTLQKIIEKWGI